MFATCHTDLCQNEGIPIDVGQVEPGGTVVCGVCDAVIQDVSEDPALTPAPRDVHDVQLPEPKET